MKHFIMIVLMIFSFSTITVKASGYEFNTENYTTVESDLEEMNIDVSEKLPDTNSEPEIELLTVIEDTTDTANNLYLYFYLKNPVHEIKSVRIYNADNYTDFSSYESGINEYNLTLISRSENGSLLKLKVEHDFSLSSSRYYGIVRCNINYVVSEMTLTRVCGLAHSYCFHEEAESKIMEYEKMEVIELENEFVGYILLFDYAVPTGAWWSPNFAFMKQHFFITFDVVNFDIDDLLEIEIDYDIYKVEDKKTYLDPSYTETFISSFTETVSYSDLATSEEAGHFFWKKTYSWDKIASLEEAVLNSTAIDSYVIPNEALDKEWIVYFGDENASNNGYFDYVNQFSVIYGQIDTYYKSSDTTVIRMKFIDNDIIYDLPSVSQETDSFNLAETIDIVSSIINFFQNNWIYIVGAIVVLLVLYLLSILAPVLKMIIFIVKLPFVIIGKIIKAIKRE